MPHPTPRPTARRAITTVPGALLVSPDPQQLVEAPHRLLVDSLIDTAPDGDTPHGPCSVAWVLIPPGGSTDAHRHATSWAHIVVLSCGAEGAVTQLGPSMEHVLVQFAWQLVRIEPGVEHRAWNPSEHEWVIAIEFRDSASVFDDRPLLPHLNGIPLPTLPQLTPPAYHLPHMHASQRPTHLTA